MAEKRQVARTPSGRGQPPVTIYDVARLSGVSPSTVSRALNMPGRLSATTEKRIREVADAVGYRLNPMARALPTGRTHTVGLLLAEMTNPVYLDLVRSVGRAASSHGYNLILAESVESGDLENETAQRLLNSVDGLILASTGLSNAQICTLAERKPLFVVNRKVRGVPGVVPDLVPGISAALDHLGELGHRSLAYLAGPPTSWMSRHRGSVLESEADARGMTVTKVKRPVQAPGAGAVALRAIEATGASVALVFNGLMATDLLVACQESGVGVPSELSLIAFEDIFGAAFTSPPLTVIRTPLGSLGHEAARRLVAVLENGDDADATPLSTEFVLRGSTAPPRS